MHLGVKIPDLITAVSQGLLFRLDVNQRYRPSAVKAHLALIMRVEGLTLLKGYKTYSSLTKALKKQMPTDLRRERNFWHKALVSKRHQTLGER